MNKQLVTTPQLCCRRTVTALKSSPRLIAVLAVLSAALVLVGASAASAAQAPTTDTSAVAIARRAAASSLANVVAVASNNLSESDCALLSTGKVNCWGLTASVGCGNGIITNDSDVPVAVTGISDAKAVASDSLRQRLLCRALDRPGEVLGLQQLWPARRRDRHELRCAGIGQKHHHGHCSHRRIFHGTPASAPCCRPSTSTAGGTTAPASWATGPPRTPRYPSPCHTITNAAALISGYGGFCALLSTSHVNCWGDNSYGELGRATPRRTTPMCPAR